MPLGVVWWVVAILLGLVAIGIIIALTYLVKEIAGLFTHKPISEEIKATWDKETLISVIGDFEAKLIDEEKLPGPPTPPEELETKSEDELRIYTDELAEMIVPPPVEGLGLALAAAAVLGLGALALGAYAVSQPKEAKKK